MLTVQSHAWGASLRPRAPSTVAMVEALAVCFVVFPNI
jgi:hypothetical protein